MIFAKTFTSNINLIHTGSPNMTRRTSTLSDQQSMVHASSVPIFHGPDSSSATSSCTSSTPSSPNLFNQSSSPPSTPHPSPQIQITSDTQFNFPGIPLPCLLDVLHHIDAFTLMELLVYDLVKLSYNIRHKSSLLTMIFFKILSYQV